MISIPAAFRAAAVLAVGLFAAPAAWAQLSNGGFDSGGGSLAGWTPFNNGANNVVTSSTTPRSSPACAKIFGGFNGNPNYSGIFQNVPTVAGQQWQLSAYVRHNAGDSLQGTSNKLVMKIEFYRVSGGAYGTPDMLAESQTDALTSASPLGTWVWATWQATAPAQAVEARVSFVFIQVGSAGGSALLDDVTFSAGASPPPTSWTLIWSDEFSAGGVDATKWRVEDRHLIKNNELQYYAPDEVYVQSGSLVLRSRARVYSGYDSNGNWGTYNYTSALVESRARFAMTYGRVEVRAKLPYSRGLWPAHWMLPTSGSWPPEIDIMELLGHEPTRIYMTHHWGSWPSVQSDGGQYVGPNYSLGFHTFAIEWSPARIDWLIDGVLRFSSGVAIPAEPFYLILNTAVGGDFPGNPDGSTVFPQYHEIDYVRVYVPDAPGAAVVQRGDTTRIGALADGVLSVSEYPASINGVNSGFGDRIGAQSLLHLDSSADGRLNLALQSHSAWPAPTNYGAVVYVDSVAGGFASTYELGDVADRPRRLASGKGAGGQRSDLYFALGFLADFAIVLEDNAATIYRLDRSSHTRLNGAALNSASDLLGGHAVAYRIDNGSAGGALREFQMPLALLGLAPGDSLRFVVTMLNSDNAFRTNEFFGASPGNPWDTVNPGAGPAVLKPGDFAEFHLAMMSSCGSACGVGGQSADFDFDCDVDSADLGVLLSNYQSPLPVTRDRGDADGDGDVDEADLGVLLGLYGATCP
ncbi:MAG: family 16 glycosylhydrolase [Phycisphaerae bacterium]